MANILRIRIAADISDFDSPRNIITGRTPKFWRNSDFQIELGIFQQTTLQSLSNLSSVTAEIRPIGENDTAPSNTVTPILAQTVSSANFDTTVTEETWKAGTAQQVTFTFSSDATAVDAMEAWLVIYATTSDATPKTITLCSGRISILESSGGASGTPPEPVSYYYTKTQCDALFLKTANNLSEINDTATARQNLNLGAAATYGVKDEDDMASDSASDLPTQQSTKAYVDSASNAVKSFTEEQIAALNDLWPSNANFAYWSCAKEPKCESQTFIPAADGWVIYRYDSYSGSLSRVAKAYRVADGNDLRNYFLRFHKINSNRENSQMNLVRPFTTKELTPLKGLTQVTLSFDFLCGADMQEAYPPHIYIFGHTSTSIPEQNLTSYQVADAGSSDYGVKFSTDHITILDEELSIVTDTSVRITKTFTLPSGLQQLAICFYFRNTNTYGNVGDNCWIQIGKMRLDKGATAYDFVVGNEGENELKNRERYQRIIFSFRGRIDNTQYGECTRNFFPKYMNSPTCIYNYENISPVNVYNSSINDPYSMKNADDSYSSASVNRMGTQSTVFDSYYYTSYTFVDKKLW